MPSEVKNLIKSIILEIEVSAGFELAERCEETAGDNQDVVE